MADFSACTADVSDTFTKLFVRVAVVSSGDAVAAAEAAGATQGDGARDCVSSASLPSSVLQTQLGTFTAISSRPKAASVVSSRMTILPKCRLVVSGSRSDLATPQGSESGGAAAGLHIRVPARRQHDGNSATIHDVKIRWQSHRGR